jgi:hypothetical protein
MQSVQPNKARSLNAAARTLVEAHRQKPAAQGWRYGIGVAVETICKTFVSCPDEAGTVLEKLMSAERLAQFPHEDLWALSKSIQYLPAEGSPIVVRLFEAAFADEPVPGKWEQFGSVILPMQIQSSDQWNSIHHQLAEYYGRCDGRNAAVLTDAACIAWSSISRRRSRNGRAQEEWPTVIATVEFRGKSCRLIQDYSYIWQRNFEPEEDRILARFENYLREWAAAGDVTRLNTALDKLVGRDQSALMWSVFMKAGAEHPKTLGGLLATLLNDPTFLINPDYSYAATELLAALHKEGDHTVRDHLETLILHLPQNAPLHKDEERVPTPPRFEHAQNRLLGALAEENIVQPTLLDLWRTKNSANVLRQNLQPEGVRITEHTFSEEELIGRQGINLQTPENKRMFLLREALKPFLASDKSSFDVRHVERNWNIINRCEQATESYATQEPQMANDLRGHLVGACEKIAQFADWPPNSARWKIVRRVLLKGASDPDPPPDNPDGTQDSCSAWGWPAPRVDAARGLLLLIADVGKADADISTALKALTRDKSGPVRFNLASGLPILANSAPVLMWELIGILVAEEQHYSVLDAVTHSLDWLWPKNAKDVLSRLRTISAQAADAPVGHAIHVSLAHAHLFQFLRTGRTESEQYIAGLIERCGDERESKALLGQLHTCRVGGWMTAGDAVTEDIEADCMRTRTWGFLSNLLASTQVKLVEHRSIWLQLRDAGKLDSPEIDEVRGDIDRLARLVDAIAMQLYFASGAFADKGDNNEDKLTAEQLLRFWKEASPLLKALAEEPHPHTAYHLVQALDHLLPCDPEQVFLLAVHAIRTSCTAGFQHESLAVDEVVKIVQRVLADHRDIFRGKVGTESRCLVGLLDVLDLFVEAGWPQARQLTHRLEEIYR